MALRQRGVQLFLGAVVVFVGTGGACSSFTERDPATDADADVDAEAGADAPPPSADSGPDAVSPRPTLVATSDTSAVVDVRLDDARVLWTTSQGEPWSGNTVGNFYGAPASGAMQTLGAGVTIYLMGSRTGSLAGDGTVASAWVSEIAATGLLQNIDAMGFSRAPLPVGPVPIRLVDSRQMLYWLSRDATQNRTTVWSSTSDGIQQNELGSLMDDMAFDLALEEAASGTIMFVASTQGIYGARVGSGADFSEIVHDATVTSITASSSGLYWTTTAGVASYCGIDFAGNAPLACAAPTKVLTPTNDAVRNVKFDHGALFAATAGGSIYECSSDASCPTTPIVQGAALFDGDEYRFGHAMAASDTALFWAEGAAGAPHRIMRVSR